jgi:hypothetical protein
MSLSQNYLKLTKLINNVKELEKANKLSNIMLSNIPNSSIPSNILEITNNEITNNEIIPPIQNSFGLVLPMESQVSLQPVLEAKWNVVSKRKPIYPVEYTCDKTNKKIYVCKTYLETGDNTKCVHDDNDSLFQHINFNLCTYYKMNKTCNKGSTCGFDHIRELRENPNVITIEDINTKERFIVCRNWYYNECTKKSNPCNHNPNEYKHLTKRICYFFQKNKCKNISCNYMHTQEVILNSMKKMVLHESKNNFKKFSLCQENHYNKCKFINNDCKFAHSEKELHYNRNFTVLDNYINTGNLIPLQEVVEYAYNFITINFAKYKQLCVKEEKKPSQTIMLGTVNNFSSILKLTTWMLWVSKKHEIILDKPDHNLPFDVDQFIITISNRFDICNKDKEHILYPKKNEPCFYNKNCNKFHLSLANNVGNKPLYFCSDELSGTCKCKSSEDITYLREHCKKRLLEFEIKEKLLLKDLDNSDSKVRSNIKIQLEQLNIMQYNVSEELYTTIRKTHFIKDKIIGPLSDIKIKIPDFDPNTEFMGIELSVEERNYRMQSIREQIINSNNNNNSILKKSYVKYLLKIIIQKKKRQLLFKNNVISQFKDSNIYNVVKIANNIIGFKITNSSWIKWLYVFTNAWCYMTLNEFINDTCTKENTPYTTGITIDGSKRFANWINSNSKLSYSDFLNNVEKKLEYWIDYENKITQTKAKKNKKKSSKGKFRETVQNAPSEFKISKYNKYFDFWGFMNNTEKNKDLRLIGSQDDLEMVNLIPDYFSKFMKSYSLHKSTFTEFINNLSGDDKLIIDLIKTWKNKLIFTETDTKNFIKYKPNMDFQEFIKHDITLIKKWIIVKETWNEYGNESNINITFDMFNSIPVYKSFYKYMESNMYHFYKKCSSHPFTAYLEDERNNYTHKIKKYKKEEVLEILISNIEKKEIARINAIKEEQERQLEQQIINIRNLKTMGNNDPDEYVLHKKKNSKKDKIIHNSNSRVKEEKLITNEISEVVNNEINNDISNIDFIKINNNVDFDDNTYNIDFIKKNTGKKDINMIKIGPFDNKIIYDIKDAIKLYLTKTGGKANLLKVELDYIELCAGVSSNAKKHATKSRTYLYEWVPECVNAVIPKFIKNCTLKNFISNNNLMQDSINNIRKLCNINNSNNNTNNNIKTLNDLKNIKMTVDNYKLLMKDFENDISKCLSFLNNEKNNLIKFKDNIEDKLYEFSESDGNSISLEEFLDNGYDSSSSSSDDEENIISLKTRIDTICNNNIQKCYTVVKKYNNENPSKSLKKLKMFYKKQIKILEYRNLISDKNISECKLIAVNELNNIYNTKKVTAIKIDINKLNRELKNNNTEEKINILININNNNINNNNNILYNEAVDQLITQLNYSKNKLKLNEEMSIKDNNKKLNNNKLDNKKKNKLNTDFTVNIIDNNISDNEDN